MNLERAYMLMLVIKEAGLHGGMYKPIAGVASLELKALMAEAEAVLKEEAKVEAEKVAEAEAVRQAEAEESAKLSEQDLGTNNRRALQEEVAQKELAEARATRRPI